MSMQEKIIDKRMPGDDVILSVESLKKYFPIRGSLFKRQTSSVKAVDAQAAGVRRE